MKRIILSVLLVTALVVSLVPFTASAASNGTPVSTAAEFESMVSGGTYYLANDIDLGGKKYECCIFEEFSGVLDGNGHCVFNFSIDNNGIESDIGLIKRANKIGTLEITDLTIGKENQPVVLNITSSGKSHGVLAGAQENANSMKLTNVYIYAKVTAPTTGKANVGGFIGYSRAVTFINCGFYGSIEVGSGLDKVDEVYHNAGGFIGSCNSDMTSFDNCENHANITTYCSSLEARAAGFVSYTGTGLSMNKCRNFGDITVEDCGLQMADGQVAGFIAHANKTTPVLIDYCENYGKITGSNFCAGFVANVTSGAMFTDCVNEGEYNRQALINGPFVANVSETAIVEYSGNNVDKIDPSVVWGTTAADTTTAAPDDTTTPAPIDTTTPAPIDTTTPAPKDTTTAAPQDTTTATPQQTEKKGCGSAMVSAGLIAVIGLGWAVIRKKEK